MNETQTSALVGALFDRRFTEGLAPGPLLDLCLDIQLARPQLSAAHLVALRRWWTGDPSPDRDVFLEALTILTRHMNGGDNAEG